MKFVFSFRNADIKLEAIAMIENNFEVPPLMQCLYHSYN